MEPESSLPYSQVTCSYIELLRGRYTTDEFEVPACPSLECLEMIRLGWWSTRIMPRIYNKLTNLDDWIMTKLWDRLEGCIWAAVLKLMLLELHENMESKVQFGTNSPCGLGTKKATKHRNRISRPHDSPNESWLLANSPLFNDGKCSGRPTPAVTSVLKDYNCALLEYLPLFLRINKKVLVYEFQLLHHRKILLLLLLFFFFFFFLSATTCIRFWFMVPCFVFQYV
jgi:hypothetical protein